MFTQKDLKGIDRRYFTVISEGCYGVTLLSKNTNHCWYISSEDYGNFHTCTIRHSHHGPYTPMHMHGYGRTLKSCMAQIKSHDEYQLRKDARKRMIARDRRMRHGAIEADSLITTI